MPQTSQRARRPGGNLTAGALSGVLMFNRRLIARRTILGIGAALLFGGWGMTQLAHERIMHYPTADLRRVWAWSLSAPAYRESGFFVTPRTMYMLGVAGMAAGAGLIAFVSLRKE